LKRLPIFLSLLALIALAISIAYWVLQLYQPPQRPIAAAPQAALPPPSVDAAATIFGGQSAAALATNYTLTGVVAAGRDSVAIIVAEGSPPKALRIGREVVPGVTVSEVHRRYVMLSDGGVMKRIDLPADTRGTAAAAGAPAPAASAPPGEPAVSPGPVQTQEVQPAETPAVVGRPATMPPGEPAPSAAPSMPQMQQMPPPTRASGSPVSQQPVTR
jgi:general secretion pathway protein C